MGQSERGLHRSPRISALSMCVTDDPQSLTSDLQSECKVRQGLVAVRARNYRGGGGRIHRTRAGEKLRPALHFDIYCSTYFLVEAAFLRSLDSLVSAFALPQDIIQFLFPKTSTAVRESILRMR
jgi:hypothetical protein